jgi:hypothetical protein
LCLVFKKFYQTIHLPQEQGVARQYTTERFRIRKRFRRRRLSSLIEVMLQRRPGGLCCGKSSQNLRPVSPERRPCITLSKRAIRVRREAGSPCPVRKIRCALVIFWLSMR